MDKQFLSTNSTNIFFKKIVLDIQCSSSSPPKAVVDSPRHKIRYVPFFFLEIELYFSWNDDRIHPPIRRPSSRNNRHEKILKRINMTFCFVLLLPSSIIQSRKKLRGKKKSSNEPYVYHNV